VIAAIRKNSSNLVIVGSPDWSKAVDQAANSPVTDANVAYTFHFYACTHGASYRTKVSNAAAKIPLFFTEWGTTEASGGGSVCISEADAWLQLAKDKKISWANWSLSAQNESSAALKAGSSTSGGWNDGNLTASGSYVFGKIKEVVPGTARNLESARPSNRGLQARRVPQGLEIELPPDTRDLRIFAPDGRELVRQELSSERVLRIPSPGAGVLAIRATTARGEVSTRVAPVR